MRSRASIRGIGGAGPPRLRAIRNRLSLAASAVLALASPAAAMAGSATPSGDAGVTGAAEARGPGVGDAAPARRRAAEWHEVGQQAGLTYNCVGNYYEQLGNGWAGWYGDLGVTPQTNQVYYVKAGWGVSGFPCGTGGARVHLELVLPAHSQLAINQNNRVRCWYQSPEQTALQEFTQDCPQSPGNGINGGPSFDPPGEAAWPTATGAIIEIWVPIKSAQPLNGIQPPDGTPCDTCLYAGIWMIDGVNSPWVWPKAPIYVGGSATSTSPSVGYPAPSVGSIAYDTGNDNVTSRLYANVYTEGTGGPAHFEAGPAKGNYTTDGSSITIPTGGDWQAYEDWGFGPGKTFHWRLCYQPTGGNKVCGADQVFAVPPDTVIADSDIKRRQGKATFDFASPPVPNMTATFQCKLDDGRYKPCTSPRTYSNLDGGKHTVAVRAVDQDGHRDSTPAKEGFKI